MTPTKLRLCLALGACVALKLGPRHKHYAQC